MDCGVQVDAGKPIIVAEDCSKTLTNAPPNDLKNAYSRLKGGGCTGMQTNGRCSRHIQ
jgi:hypothetical protein